MQNELEAAVEPFFEEEPIAIIHGGRGSSPKFF